MQEIVCPHCGASILEDAPGAVSRCPGCGANPHRPTAAQQLAAARASQPRAKWGSWALAAVLAPCLICGACSLAGSLLPSRPRTAEEQAQVERVLEERAAMSKAREFVRLAIDESVRHTASFPLTAQEAPRSLGGGRWEIAGQVEVTNAFNATIRPPYRVVLEKAGDGWRAVSVEYGGMPVYP